MLWVERLIYHINMIRYVRTVTMHFPNIGIKFMIQRIVHHQNQFDKLRVTIRIVRSDYPCSMVTFNAVSLFQSEIHQNNQKLFFEINQTLTFECNDLWSFHRNQYSTYDASRKPFHGSYPRRLIWLPNCSERPLSNPDNNNSRQSFPQWTHLVADLVAPRNFCPADSVAAELVPAPAPGADSSLARRHRSPIACVPL